MRQVTILPAATIGAAAAGVLSQVIDLPKDVLYLAVQSKFLYGSGGTNLKVWLQTSFDDGATWRDIANHAFLLAALNKVSTINLSVAMAAPAIVVSDGALADDTIVQGLLGDRLRVKYTSTGTYAGATSLQVDLVFPEQE